MEAARGRTLPRRAAVSVAEFTRGCTGFRRQFERERTDAGAAPGNGTYANGSSYNNNGSYNTGAYNNVAYRGGGGE